MNNFLPEDYMRKRSQRRVNAVFLVLLPLVAAAVGLGVLVTEQRRAGLAAEIAAQDEAVAEVQGALATLDQIESRRRQIMAKAATSANLIDPIPHSFLIALVTNNMPPGVTVTSYNMNTREVPRPEPTTEEKSSSSRRRRQREEPQGPPPPPLLRADLDIQGQANDDLQVAEFVASLTAAPTLQRVNLHYSREQTTGDGRLVRSFKITARVEHDTQLTDEEVLVVRTAAAIPQSAGPNIMESLFRMFR